MTNFKYGYMAATSNFDLEPVISDYFEKYPNGEFANYQVVFRTRNEHTEGSHSYLIVFEHQNPQNSNAVKLYDFLKTYVEYHQKVENKDYVLTMNPHNNVLPILGSRQGHTFGKLKKD